MANIRELAAAGLSSGDRFTITRSFTIEDIASFASISRDYNPVHCDSEYAELKGMRAPIAHGLLTASLITEIGGQIGWLAASMAFQFKRPVYPGDTLTCEWLILSIDERGRAKARANVINEQGILVLIAETTGIVPNQSERAHLTQMIAAGDPTNGAKFAHRQE